MTRKIPNGTFNVDTELPPIEYGVSSLKSCIPVDDGDLSSPCLIEGDAHGGRARIYSLATSTGEPPSSSAPCTNRIKLKTQPPFLAYKT